MRGRRRAALMMRGVFSGKGIVDEEAGSACLRRRGRARRAGGFRPCRGRSGLDGGGDRERAGARPSYDPWGVDLSARDTRVQPGDDFDAYANGAWSARTEIPADQGSAGVGYDVYNLSQDQLRAIIESSAPTTPIGGMYKSFMDEARVDSLDARPLAADLARIAAVSSKEDFARLMGRSHGAFGGSLISLQVAPDPKQPNMNVLFVGQSGLGLPDRDYYLSDTFKPQRDAYRAFIERTLANVGYANPAATRTRSSPSRRRSPR